MTDAKATVSQARYMEEAIRSGHTMAAVQMWQGLLRSLALNGEGTDLIAFQLLSMQIEQSISALTVCQDLIHNGVKKLDAKAIPLLEELIRSYHEGEASERSDRSSHDEAKQATQPMTPPQAPKKRSREERMLSSPLPKLMEKRKPVFGRVLDLTAEETEEEQE